MLLNNNDEKYNRLLEHKIHQNVTNEGLRKEIQHRGYETNSIVDDFECFVCQLSIEMTTTTNEEETKQRIDQDMCGDHLTYPKMHSMPKNHKNWQGSVRQGKCEATILNDLMQKNQPFTKKQFQDILFSKYEQNLC